MSVEHFTLTFDFNTWQGRACKFFCWLGWARPAEYFCGLLADRAIDEKFGRRR